MAAGGSSQKPAVTNCDELNERARSLIAEYRSLRERRGRLPAGSFDHELSAAGGRLSSVLTSLGDELGHSRLKSSTLFACMGKPDATRNHKEMGHLLEIYNRELRKAGRSLKPSAKRKYLIYFWRGWHDFIFFISEDGIIIDHGWWFAYE
jgi:hypothetical protein